MTERPLCVCCIGIRPRPNRAVYRWTGPNNYPQPICDECCGWWLLQALDDPWLEPKGVELIEGVTA